MKHFRLVLVFALLLAGLLVVKPANAATYSVNIVQATGMSDAYATICDDDTCDEEESLFYIDPDVAGRGTGSSNAVAIDVCFYEQINSDFTGASVTSTGTLYSSSYTTDTTWACGNGNTGTYPGSYTSGTGWRCGMVANDTMHCKLRIDDDSNARITIDGHQSAADECASTSPTYPMPTFSRAFQADLWKHSDTTKSATDGEFVNFPCADGNTGVVPFLNLYYNGGGPPATYFKPATGIRIYDYGVSNSTVPGPITYHTVHTLPSYVTATSCNVHNFGSTWYSPLNPPTCVITNSGHAVTFDLKFGSDLNVAFEITGNIGSIPECPSVNQFTKDLISMDFMARTIDGAWRYSNNWPFNFKCQ